MFSKELLNTSEGRENVRNRIRTVMRQILKLRIRLTEVQYVLKD